MPQAGGDERTRTGWVPRRNKRLQGQTRTADSLFLPGREGDFAATNAITRPAGSRGKISLGFFFFSSFFPPLD